MDIQGYILDHWLAKMNADTPVLMVYDEDGFYYDLLPLAEERGIKVIDTTKGFLHARLSASRFWCNELSLNKDTRMIIYRHCEKPRDNREWIEEPYAGFRKGAILFPYGPQDKYENICRTFLPTKQNELDNLFATGSTSFNMINALLDGAAYPELEQMSGGKSFAEMTVGLLSKEYCPDMKWLTEWKSFAEVHYPNLDANGPTLKDVQMKLWAYLLFSEFVFDLPEKLPDNLKSVAIAPLEMKDKVYMICDKLRNQINLRETFVRIANKVAEQLHLADIFSKAKHLGERVTFSFENSVEYDRAIGELKEGKMDEAHAMYEKNINDVWFQEDQKVSAFWKLMKYVLIIMDCVNQGINSDGTLSDLVKWYTNSGCKADYAFRKYHTELQGLISTPKQVKELTDILNSCYRDFTEREVKIYQQSVRQLKKFPDLKNQGCIQSVYPALKTGKRVVFVMVDAFRYEMGTTFAESIERSFREHVECVPKISYLPSITRFGMANHLGEISLEIQNGKLQPVIEGTPISTPEDRVAYLKHKTGLEIQNFRLEDFEPTAINESTRLLVIRSVGIDTAGENDKLNGLPSMEREMIRLARLADDCKRLKFDLAVFVSDHGFMLQPSFRVGDKIPKPVGSSIVVDESRLQAGSINESEDTISFTPEELNAKIPVMKLCYAKNFTVFTHGEVYYHEGLSLQENVVPIISIKLQEEKDRQIFKISLTYKDKTDGTIYSRRPVIDINASYADLFAEDINIRIRVTGDDGNVIGRPEGKFYNDVTELINIPSDATKIRQPISIDDEYYGHDITLAALDADTNETLSILKLNFENN